MGIVVYSERSRADIIDIWSQVAVRSRTTADKCLDRIETRCKQIGDFPELGPARHDIAAGVRVLLADRWLIIYRVFDGHVRIARIVDSARDLSRLTIPNDEN